jgi:hypothetical protein
MGGIQAPRNAGVTQWLMLLPSKQRGRGRNNQKEHPNGYTSWMPTTPAQQRHYQANKVRYIAQAAERRLMLTEMVRRAKDKPCADCEGWFHYCAMDFDHVRGEKVGEISRLLNRGNLSLLLEEISKCDVICANCHRVRTWKRENQVLGDLAPQAFSGDVPAFQAG